MTTKNYYSVLGVLPNAEDVVVRAAYRALAQRYHPDKNTGNKEDATRRMAEINEAYTVLSDPIKRKEYDSLQRSRYGKTSGSYEDDFSQNSNGSSETDDYFEADWKLACSLYPDLLHIYAQRKKISHALAETFRIHMLEIKRFDIRWEYAEELDRAFLSIYFGNHQKLHDFARQLIMAERRDAALALNKMVSVIGGSDPDPIIRKIKEDYDIFSEQERRERQERQIQEKKKRTAIAQQTHKRKIMAQRYEAEKLKDKKVVDGISWRAFWFIIIALFVLIALLKK